MQNLIDVLKEKLSLKSFAVVNDSNDILFGIYSNIHQASELKRMLDENLKEKRIIFKYGEKEYTFHLTDGFFSSSGRSILFSTSSNFLVGLY